MLSEASYLLDTNIVVQLIRRNELGRYIDSTFSLGQAYDTSLISIVTVGEMYALARKFKWGTAKVRELRELLEQLVRVDIGENSILEAYGEIDAAMDALGQPMGKNDVWIAATARATKATLLTMDTDFNRLSPEWIDLRWIDPASVK